tara:strand:- start:45 stop:293 length:249 start_codon:yes stop_codon:yes gene_type:complete
VESICPAKAKPKGVDRRKGPDKKDWIQIVGNWVNFATLNIVGIKKGAYAPPEEEEEDEDEDGEEEDDDDGEEEDEDDEDEAE